MKLPLIALLLMAAGANADVFVNGKPAPELDRLLRESPTNHILPVEFPKVPVTVCLVTNVVETDNHKGCDICKNTSGNYTVTPAVMGLDMHLHNIPYVAATERTSTTIVTERKTLSLVWDGKPESITREREVSRTVRTWRKAEDWREVENPNKPGGAQVKQ